MGWAVSVSVGAGRAHRGACVTDAGGTQAPGCAQGPPTLAPEDGGSHGQVRWVSPDLNVLRDGSHWWGTSSACEHWLSPRPAASTGSTCHGHPPSAHPPVCSPDTPAHAGTGAHAPHGARSLPLSVPLRGSAGLSRLRHYLSLCKRAHACRHAHTYPRTGQVLPQVPRL